MRQGERLRRGEGGTHAAQDVTVEQVNEPAFRMAKQRARAEMPDVVGGEDELGSGVAREEPVGARHGSDGGLDAQALRDDVELEQVGRLDAAHALDQGTAAVDTEDEGAGNGLVTTSTDGLGEQKTEEEIGAAGHVLEEGDLAPDPGRAGMEQQRGGNGVKGRADGRRGKRGILDKSAQGRGLSSSPKNSGGLLART